MITHISYSNFKAFKSLDIDLKPLTIILGPNNSGKSSLLAGLKILSQTRNSYDGGVPLLLNGEFGDFGTYRDVVFENSPKRQMSISLSYNLPSDGKRYLRRLNAKKATIDITFKYRSVRREIVINRFALKLDDKESLIATYSPDSENYEIERLSDKKFPNKFRSFSSKLLSRHNFLVFTRMALGFNREELISTTSKDFVSYIQQSDDLFRELSLCSYELLDIMSNFEYIGAMREPPSRNYIYSGEHSQRVGATGKNSINILAMDSLKKGKKSINILDKINAWMNKAGLAKKLSIVPISDRYYELRVQHPDGGESSNFADVGFGLSQVIPVLVAGYNLEKSGMLLVEEPEIHLHPKAQSELGDFFLDLYQQGTRAVVETHSEHLILRLQQHVAEGKIKLDDIVFYYIYSKDGEKISKKLTLDDFGRFKEDWPNGFFPEKLEEATKLSLIRSKKQLHQK